ncbi:tyrosine-protein phosphatase [Cryptosporangium aurantiacum]|uniref:Protein tyrosine/serine phosphatase n=1 Tax=Cryptosporangium aurantiacum TaxID=134849 RepID=A0A1M7JL26_9ACTN|nr:tyrosine-protein phosphatase [Cryptosporangium aurantiacum]SHM53819.1 Protein tyrosine/serine phosphatase [Cryptosporangium aurantiacum]
MTEGRLEPDTRTERVVRLEGASNVRDLGGLTTTDGRQTRFGLLYRADAPSELTAADVRTLVTERGLRQVVDLRSLEEVTRDGRSALREAVAGWANHSMSSDPGVGQVVPEILRGNLTGHYLGYLGSGAERVVAAARLLTDPERQPALVHCAAGKDRTGTLVAILLDAAGVRRDEIVADYALTDANMDGVIERVIRRMRAAGAEIPSQANTLPDEARRARPETMAAFLDQLTTVFGGGAGWLLAHGFADADLTRFRNSFLTA